MSDFPWNKLDSSMWVSTVTQLNNVPKIGTCTHAKCIQMQNFKVQDFKNTKIIIIKLQNYNELGCNI